jgi:proliferating cell nuclear antigen
MSDNIVEVKTVQSSAFKNFIEAVKEILSDVNIQIDKSGIRILTINNNNSILMYSKLEAKNFESFYCKDKIIIGVNMTNFFKIIKTITSSDSLTLFIEKNRENSLGIKIENIDKKIYSKYYLNLIEVDDVSYEIPSVQFQSIITMPSNEFNKICKDMHSLEAEIVEIKSVGNKLIFSCSSQIADRETIIEENSDSEGLNFMLSSNNDIIQGYYNLKDLNLFAKCTNLCLSIQLLMKNNFPLIIKFEIANLGYLQLGLSPKIEI